MLGLVVAPSETQHYGKMTLLDLGGGTSQVAGGQECQFQEGKGHLKALDCNLCVKEKATMHFSCELLTRFKHFKEVRNQESQFQEGKSNFISCERY